MSAEPIHKLAKFPSEQEFQSQMEATFARINQSLQDGRVFMEKVSLILENTSKLATETHNRVNILHGWFKWVQGAMAVIGTLALMFCWILLQENDDIRELTRVAITNQQELISERVKRDQQWEILRDEIKARALMDTKTLDLLLNSSAARARRGEK